MEKPITREDVIEFLIDLGKYCPTDIARYAGDTDEGFLAFGQMWDNWKAKQK